VTVRRGERLEVDLSYSTPNPHDLLVSSYRYVNVSANKVVSSGTLNFIEGLCFAD
jgi:hypothetical protein